jgi:DNA repair protein RadC
MNGLRFQISETAPKHLFGADDEESAFSRLQIRGAGALSTTELLSLFITPKRGETSEEAARKLWNNAGSLRGLLKNDAKELMNLGATPKTAVTIAAAAELAKRVSEEDIRTAETLSGAEEAYHFLKPHLADLPHEVFAMILLNQKHGVLSYREMFRGTISASSVHPREIVKEVLKENAAAVILAHNHPSGHVSPSPDDLRLTEDIRSMLKHIDCRVVDHLIVGGNGYFSFSREGLLNG